MASCTRCGKAARLAPCYTTEDGEIYHYVCCMINVNLEKPIALELDTNFARLTEFQKTILGVTNNLRRKHGSADLKWSKKCEQHAQKWLDHLISLNTGPDVKLQLVHDSYKGMGENLYLQDVKTTLDPCEAATRVVNSWYSEEEDYNYDNNEFNEETSHFTQLVWKGTWKMGAAYGQVGNVFVAVCNFWPAGNIQSWFLDNVKSPQ